MPLTELTDEQFHKRVVDSRETVIVQFWAPWCGPCRRIAPLIATMQERLHDRLRFFKVNTDENPDSPADWDIQAIPTFLLFHNGKLIERWSGRKQSTAMTKEIDGVLEEHNIGHND